MADRINNAPEFIFSTKEDYDFKHLYVFSYLDNKILDIELTELDRINCNANDILINRGYNPAYCSSMFSIDELHIEKTNK